MSKSKRQPCDPEIQEEEFLSTAKAREFGCHIAPNGVIYTPEESEKAFEASMEAAVELLRRDFEQGHQSEQVNRNWQEGLRSVEFPLGIASDESTLRVHPLKTHHQRPGRVTRAKGKEGNSRVAFASAAAAIVAGWLFQKTATERVQNPAVVIGRVTRVFDLVELFFPKRITSEEIGDALEVITKRIQDGCPAWHVYVKMVTTLFWIVTHAVHEVVRGPAKKQGN